MDKILLGDLCLPASKNIKLASTDLIDYVDISSVDNQAKFITGYTTYEYQDAVWAYYFYRMISRAENVWMLVDSRTEGLKSGEESRYIKQLEYHFGVPVKRYVVKYDRFALVEFIEFVVIVEALSVGMDAADETVR